MRYLNSFKKFNESSSFPEEASRLGKILSSYKDKETTLGLKKFTSMIQKELGDYLESGYNKETNEIIFDTNSGWKYVVGVKDINNETGDITLPVTYTDFHWIEFNEANSFDFKN
jgi:hypothetical protein